MKYKTAVNIAIDCMRRRQRYYAFDANLQKKLNVGTPHAVRAAKEYDKIEQAIAVLSQQPMEI